MVLKKLKVGMKVYRIEKATGLQRYNSKWNTWAVYIEDIDFENERVFARINARTEWYGKHIWSKWRMEQPMS